MSSEAESIIRQRLIAARERAGMTQSQVGEALGVSHSTISAWERGYNNTQLTLSNLARMCELYALPAHMLFGSGITAEREARGWKKAFHSLQAAQTKLNEDGRRMAQLTAQYGAEYFNAIDILAEMVTKAETEASNQKDIAERFQEHANAIWNSAFPSEPDGWEYGGQLERCVIQRITALEAERDRLRTTCATLLDLLARGSGEDSPEYAQARALLDGNANDAPAP